MTLDTLRIWGAPRSAISALAIIAMTLVSGCAQVGGVITPTPGANSDIQIAFTAICDPTSGLLAAAAPFATAPGVSPYFADAQQLCANGVPSNIIVGGLDVFDLYVDLSQALAKKSVVSSSVVKQAKFMRLAHRG